MRKELQLLLKPMSSDCNMRCAYCFYHDEARHRQTPSYGKMTQETLRTVVRRALQYADSCVFGFQGGEPTLAGIEFYREFAEMVRRERQPGQQIFCTIQTNGLLLDDVWCSFLKEEGFLAGISLDGTGELNDRNRKDAAGQGTYTRVLRNAKALLNAGVPVNILCVLTKQNAKKIRSIYENLKKQGFRSQQYIPCLDPLPSNEGSRTADMPGVSRNPAGTAPKSTPPKSIPYALGAEAYAEVLKTLFDLWFADAVSGTPVYVRDMDNWLHVLRGGEPEACAMYGKCTMQNVIEANGDVFPCDFYVLDEFCMGNIHDYGFGDFRRMAEEKEQIFFKDAQSRDHRCTGCRWYPLCRGGCRRDCRIVDTAAENRWCEAYQEFFSYAIERLEWLAAR